MSRVEVPFLDEMVQAMEDLAEQQWGLVEARKVPLPASLVSEVLRWAWQVAALHSGREVAELDCVARRLTRELNIANADARAKAPFMTSPDACRNCGIRARSGNLCLGCGRTRCP